VNPTYLLRCLESAKTAKPRSAPKIIDSNGNPGTGGNDIGDVAETELEVSSPEVAPLLVTVVAIEVVTMTVGSATVVDKLGEITVFTLVVEL
jgi:hypothetical protein